MLSLHVVGSLGRDLLGRRFSAHDRQREVLIKVYDALTDDWSAAEAVVGAQLDQMIEVDFDGDPMDVPEERRAWSKHMTNFGGWYPS